MSKKPMSKKRRFWTLTVDIILSFIIILVAVGVYFQMTYSSNKEKSIYVKYQEAVETFGSIQLDTADLIIDGFIYKLREHKINKIYLNIIENCSCLYNTNIYSVNNNISSTQTTDFDFIKSLIVKAHEKNIKVIAWYNPLSLGDGSNINFEGLMQNYDYYNIESNYYLLPASSKAQTLATNLVREIITMYDFDGILFDEYTYPTQIILYDNQLESYEVTCYNDYSLTYNEEIAISKWRKYGLSSLLKSTHTLLNNNNKTLSVSIDSSVTKNNSLYVDHQAWLKQVGYADTIIINCKNNKNYTEFKNKLSKFIFNRFSYIPNLEIKINVKEDILFLGQIKNGCQHRLFNFGYDSYYSIIDTKYDTTLYDIEKIKDILNNL